MSEQAAFGLMYLCGVIAVLCAMFCVGDFLMKVLYVVCKPYRRWFDSLCEMHEFDD